MEKDFYINVYNKIQNSLSASNVKKKELAERLNISQTALSNQLKALRQGQGINIKTLKAVEELTGVNFFAFNIQKNSIKELKIYVWISEMDTTRKRF